MPFLISETSFPLIPDEPGSVHVGQTLVCLHGFPSSSYDFVKVSVTCEFLLVEMVQTYTRLITISTFV